MTVTPMEVVTGFLRAVERGASFDELRGLLHPEVTHTEYPNRLVPTGIVRDLRAMGESAERGQAAVREQRYVVRHAVERGDTVALEVDWSATLRVPVGALAAGAAMRASFAAFYTVREGRITAIREYTCFEPF